jgi:hypothetical protein
MVARREALRGLALVPSLPLVAPSRGRKGGTSQNLGVVPLAIEVSGSTFAEVVAGPGPRAPANTRRCGKLRNRSRNDRTAACAVRQVRAQMLEGKRGVNDPGAGLRLSPHAYPSGSFTPRVPLFGEAHVWCSIVRRICGTDRADRTMILRQMRCAIQTAITSGIVRARHDAVQGSPLRSDRAHSRAARACYVFLQGPWVSECARP